MLPVRLPACHARPQVNALDDSKAVFYWALAPLAAFYGLFAALLLPNASWLHPTALAEHWIAALPESVSCFVKVGRCRLRAPAAPARRAGCS